VIDAIDDRNDTVCLRVGLACQRRGALWRLYLVDPTMWRQASSMQRKTVSYFLNPLLADVRAPPDRRNVRRSACGWR